MKWFDGDLQEPNAELYENGMRTFYEFFAGCGMARAGLGGGWDCAFANDFSDMKAATYAANWDHELRCADVATIKAQDLPGTADLVWASFPCQDLSLAGDYRGLGLRSDNRKTRSGSFWPFWDLMRSLAAQGRAPRSIMLENVYGAITSNGGKDFGAIASALSAAGYTFGAVVVNAKLFVPQSRPRLFIYAVRSGVPSHLVGNSPSEDWHPAALVSAAERLPKSVRNNWVWWNLPQPKKRSKVFADLIEEKPASVEWDTPAKTKQLLAMMSDLNRSKVRTAQAVGTRIVGGVYKRTRVEAGTKVQRAEVRFDDISGCLRTAKGGSSRQRILVIDGPVVRSRLLSTREAARLMGLPDSFKLPANYNDAYCVAGDGVVVGVVRHLAKHLIEPAVEPAKVFQAAE